MGNINHFNCMFKNSSHDFPEYILDTIVFPCDSRLSQLSKKFTCIFYEKFQGGGSTLQGIAVLERNRNRNYGYYRVYGTPPESLWQGSVSNMVHQLITY